MAFPNVDWTVVKTHLRQAMAAQGSDIDFTLRTGETFTIKGSQGHRAEGEITDGLPENRSRFRVMSDDWDAEAPAGRIPERGDRFTMWGRTMMIDQIRPRGAGNQVLMYVFTAQG